MAHKSHRQKALQAQLEAPAAISLVTAPPAKASSSKLRASMPAHATTAMDVDSDEENSSRGEDDSDDDEDDDDDDDAMADEMQHFAPAADLPPRCHQPQAPRARARASHPSVPLRSLRQYSRMSSEGSRFPPHRMTPSRGNGCTSTRLSRRSSSSRSDERQATRC